AGRKVAGKVSADPKKFGLFAISLAVHGAIAGAMLAFVPALTASEDGQLDSDMTKSLIATLAVAQDREEKAQAADKAENTTADHQGGTGSRSAGEEGKIGSQTSTQTNRHYAVSGGGERMLSRADAIKDAQTFGMAGMLASLEDSRNAPTAIWGDVATGPDALTANGNMWGAEPGEASGLGGLGLSGIGEGGGSRGWGVGLGTIGTVDHGSGTCTSGDCQGFGAFSGRLPGTYTPKARSGMRQGKTDVTGRLPPEVIQRIVRQNFGRFRACYESALRTNPNLEGRVAVSFVIGSDGVVGSASNAGSSLPDSGVVNCVVKGFYGLSFPQPDGGVVRVSYPITFSPN
ncbi:MAG TPA: AgmX/PglI C-terminal domain-containing protein, partial [Polyangiaceae bacterium]|nr:AgmX/PglI C-terminal domain-containing protein [Polyangiaceae bacterium]